MTAMSQSAAPRLKYHADAYRFVSEALHYTQHKLRRPTSPRDVDDERGHISGPELLDGIRELALERYGPLARSLFLHWGIKATDDFGRIVFELIELGEMRKTDRDQLSDFFGVYSFDEAFDEKYQIDVSV
jgi:uncharacterized repeat protein (TIGR04138 family)